MRVLVHLGLNKCASTYVQQTLRRAGPGLQAQGVAYPGQGAHGCQYGLSKYYGFGPDSPDVDATSVSQLLDEAAAGGCDRVILSSEYLSLWRPAAAERLVADLERAGARAEYVLFSRSLLGWIAALFNQYVKTVDQKTAFASINGFVDQVLANRAVDIARRYRMWVELVSDAGLRHYRLSDGNRAGATGGDVISPFEAFAGCAIPRARETGANRSLSADQLHSIGLLRQGKPCVGRERAIQRILDGGTGESTAPEDYLRITFDRLARLKEEVDAPYLALPWSPLPSAWAENAETRLTASGSDRAVLQAGLGWARRVAQTLPHGDGVGA